MKWWSSFLMLQYSYRPHASYIHTTAVHCILMYSQQALLS